MTLLLRIVREKRARVIALCVLVLINVLVYALVVYPLVRRSAGAADRAARAAEALKVAERDYAAANALVAGKVRAQEALTTFYGKVLPQDFVAARRLTYTRLPALAKTTNVRYQGGSFELDPSPKMGRVGRLHTKMVLQGEYENIRRFVFDLETSPDFLIIDAVTLVQGEAGKPLSLNLELSTYFRRPNGS
jgi:hypothetical protein